MRGKEKKKRLGNLPSAALQYPSRSQRVFRGLIAWFAGRSSVERSIYLFRETSKLGRSAAGGLVGLWVLAGWLEACWVGGGLDYDSGMCVRSRSMHWMSPLIIE